MINVVITGVRNYLDPTYGGGARVLGLLKGLSNSTCVGKIVIVSPFASKIKENVQTYFSHKNFSILQPVHYIDIMADVNPFRTLALTKVIKKFNINLIQHEETLGVISSNLAAKYCDIALVIDEHNFVPQYSIETGRHTIIQKYLNFLDSFSFKEADQILTVSEEDKQSALTYYRASSDRVTVIPNGVDTNMMHPVTACERMKAKSRLGLEGKFVLVFHGSMDYGPNRQAVSAIEDFILPSVIQKIPNVFCLVLGRNPPKKHNRHRFLKVTGYVPHLFPYLAASDVAVVPLSKGGGTKLKVLDYLSMGIPIVATRKAVEGLPVKHKINCLLSDSVDQEFISNILLLNNEIGLAEFLSRNEREFSMQYDWRKIGEKLGKVYEQIVH